MPRLARLDAPGLLQHVMARGIERCVIFPGKFDYVDFIERLESGLEKSPNTILAWALMPNHFHLLVRSGASGIPSLMRRVMTGYAVGFNRRHKRVGHLFQNRYKSVVCEEETYLLELVRYIHLNPLRAGIVPTMEALNGYPYTGHSALVGGIKRSWQATGEILARFGSRGGEARRRYMEFMTAGWVQGPRPNLAGGGLVRSLGGMAEALKAQKEGAGERFDERVLGSGVFVESVVDRLENKKKDTRDLKMSRDELVEKVAEAMGVPKQDLLVKGRTGPISRAKAVLIHLGVDRMGLSVREMAELTRMSGPSASVARWRGREFASKNLNKLFN